MRDGAAVGNRVGVRRRENHPVRLPLAVGARGQFRRAARHPWVAAVSEHGVLPQGRAGAVGEADAFVVVVDVRVVG